MPGLKNKKVDKSTKMRSKNIYISKVQRSRKIKIDNIEVAWNGTESATLHLYNYNQFKILINYTILPCIIYKYVGLVNKTNT